MWNTGRASRNALCSALCLGEATVKTSVKHLKMQGLVKTSNWGMKMTDKRKGLVRRITISNSGGNELA